MGWVNVSVPARQSCERVVADHPFFQQSDRLGAIQEVRSYPERKTPDTRPIQPGKIHAQENSVALFTLRV